MSEAQAPVPEDLVAPPTNEARNKEAIDKLSLAILKVVEDFDPTYDVLFAALAVHIVGYSMQYIHADVGEITPEGMAAQLTKFNSYVAAVGALKMQTTNQQLNELKERTDAVHKVRES